MSTLGQKAKPAGVIREYSILHISPLSFFVVCYILNLQKDRGELVWETCCTLSLANSRYNLI